MVPRTSLLVLALVAVPRSAEASVAADAALVDERAATLGLRRTTARSAFLDRGSVTEVRAANRASEDEVCVTIVAVAPRSLSMSVAHGEASADLDELVHAASTPDEPGRLTSQSGLVWLSGCGEAARSLDRTVVRMDAPRGAVELRVYEGNLALPPMTDELGRVPGASAPRGDPGPPLAPASLASRRARAEQAAREDGATNVLGSETPALHGGTAKLEWTALAGCHRLHAFADPSEGLPTDLDAEVRDADTGDRLDADCGEAPDVRLDFCLGRKTHLEVSFTGAREGGVVRTLDAHFPLAVGIPSHWGARVAAGFATALRRRTLVGPELGPVWETIGAQGSVATTVQVEPDRCYLASVALGRGPSRGLRISAGPRAKPSVEEVGPTQSSAAVTFCAEGAREARVFVDVPGAQLGWVAALWPIGVTPAEEAAP